MAIENQVAVTKVDQLFYNPNDWQAEGMYIFPVPKDALVNNFAMWVDGEKIEAKILDADEAKRIYTDIVAKPMDVISGIYERFDLELTPRTRTAMLRWLEENPQGRYGVHEYRAADLGIDAALVDRYFGDYVERYGLG